VIQRVYEEGEEELAEGEEDGDDAALAGLNVEKDEKTFLLDESLHLRCDTRVGGEDVIAWRDLSGDPGDLYEFVCDKSVQKSSVASFEVAAVECQYERKFKRSHEEATEEDLTQFNFEEHPIPRLGSSLKPKLLGASPTPQPVSGMSRNETARSMNGSPAAPVAPMVRDDTSNSGVKRNVKTDTLPGKSTMVAKKNLKTVAPPSAKHPVGKEILANEIAELHLFDFESGTFILQDSEVTTTVSGIGNWDYWLQISGDKRDWLGQPVIADINPVFNFEYLSFIFNHYTDDGSAYSWLLRFKDQDTIERFQEGAMQALWEHLNQTKWLKKKEEERDYVMEAFQDLTMEDADAEQDNKEEEEDFDEEEEEHSGQQSEHYDSDEEQDDVVVRDKSGNVNSQLAVGYKHDRSFVVRGSKIGVFKHTEDNHLEFSTNISKVQTPKGKLFSPKKVMLHAEDTNMILQNADDPNSLYRMDLEYGKVVDEWKVHDDIPVTTFAPEKKYSQMTNEQAFLGLSHNALYRIDPRLSGTKLVESELKQYASKNDFSAAATTANGYIAVASNKGDIRMFDRLGIIAKTTIPALGDPITGLDVNADGRWVLATTRTYLLLIDALQKSGKNAGKLGFEKSFAKDDKPQPRRLGLTPSHVAQFMHETKSGIAFTPARFNTGVDANETTIVTATGPFVVTWSMKKVLQARKDPYSIKRYNEDVKADDFKYGTDKNLIVALPNEVAMVAKGSLRRPTRESIVGTGARVGGSVSTPKRAGRGSHLRSEIVDSPY